VVGVEVLVVAMVSENPTGTGRRSNTFGIVLHRKKERDKIGLVLQALKLKRLGK